jgi:phosphatidate cytidylyltransferase
MLKTRILTAAVLLPLMVWGIFAGSAGAVAWVLAAFVVVGAWEWARLAGIGRLGALVYVVLLGLSLWEHTFFDALPYYMFSVMLLALLGWLVAGYAVVTYARWAGNGKIPTWLHLLAGLLVLSPSWLALVTLHAKFDDGPVLMLSMLVIVWLADTAAYFVGRRFGQRKLAPAVSPGKTREGFWGAMIFAPPLATLIYALLGGQTLSWTMFWLLAVLIVPVSVLGDLWESLLKREAGVKDSGVIFPGHGGVLDRIDSITAAAPMFLLGLLCVQMIGNA